ncbi:3-oxoacyl-[acyl-carrier-protein] reductase FabG [Cytospora mali]|uniref:3-oxoacyl-[acyl-carrier-protein] reductase FabG n=1 Tax=Cytospora mali TaxID=578113 RepID=A0A194VAL7_CYTMA|nr:3-oxoacyl-[acyl-carrier-protein] reductase FabG [Valsa mali var. pyri (nom. inval.)]
MSDQSAPALPLLGKTAIVTGASRGLGAGIAWKLASDGANVILGYTSPSSAAKITDLQEKIQSLPHKPKTHGVKADLGQLGGPKEFIDELLSWSSGDLKIDILVNNAATLTIKGLSEITIEDYDYVYNVNIRGTIFITQAVLPYLQPKGRIINLSSTAARDAIPRSSLYSSSKSAIEGLTRTWALELGGNGTTVNVISPGPVPSDMLDNVPESVKEAQRIRTPLENRFGSVEEIANMVALVASPAASWLTGQCVNMSGGYQMF